MGTSTFQPQSARLTRPAASGTDLANTALVLSVAAVAWFGWGQAQPPAGWSPALIAGSVASVATILAAIRAVRRRRGARPSMSDPAVRRAYWRIVSVEAAMCVLGLAALDGAGEPAYLPAWILLVVGVHFVPLGRLFHVTELYPAGLALGVIAVAAAIAGAVTTAQPSAVAGAGGGLALLITAWSCIRRSRTAGRP